jgi:hypothetical protein
MSAATAVPTVGTGLFVAALGALIAYGGRVELIAGYDPDRVEDEAGLAAFVGTNAILVGALTVLVGTLDALGWDGGTWYWAVYVLVVLGLAIRTVRGSRRYESSAG